MKYFDWDEEKNQKLKEERDVSFEEVVIALDEDKKVLYRGDHPNQNKYPGQKIVIVEIKEYAYIVPFVEDDEKIFFKTIIPNRKATKKYIIDKEKP